MMNCKLFNVLLDTKFPDMNKESLTKVLYATGNHEIALEILLGIYEEPVFRKMIAPTDCRVNQSFISYNPFTDKVHYKYNEIKKETGWFKKGTEELVSNLYWADDAARKLSIPEDEFKSSHERRIISETISEKWEEGSCDASTWK